MSAEAKDPEADDAASAASKAKPPRRKLFIFAGAGLFVLLTGGGGAFVLLGHHGADAKAAEEAPADSAADKSHEAAQTFVDVPPMVVNLRSADGAQRFIKLHFMLVPGGSAKTDELTKRLPLLLDAYQPFLRELRPEDLAGSAAIFRIKEEMMMRANATLGEGQVRDILIQDLIQQ